MRTFEEETVDVANKMRTPGASIFGQHWEQKKKKMEIEGREYRLQFLVVLLMLLFLPLRHSIIIHVSQASRSLIGQNPAWADHV